MADEGCRIDVWLWRARFFKSRTSAAAAIEEGRIRLGRAGETARVDKVSRTVKAGDEVVFTLGGQLICIVVKALGERRGPAAEARCLYTLATDSPVPSPLTTRPLA